MPRGRKFKLNPDITKLIIAAKRMGMSIQKAAPFAGCDPSSVARWLQDGEEDFHRKRESPQRELFVGVQKAESDRIYESMERIRAAGKGGAVIEEVTTTRKMKDGTQLVTVKKRVSSPQWQADGWFLERRHPDDFAQKVRTELTGADGGAVQVSTLADVMKLADEAEAEEKRAAKATEKKK